VGATIERLSAHIRRRFAGQADLQEDFAVQGAFADGVIAIVGAIDCIVRPHVDAMRAGKDAVAPGPQEIALTVEHDHRMLAAVEGINPVPAIHPDGSDIAEDIALGQFSPAGLSPIRKRAAADDVGHVSCFLR
jgi:hypothetical protein